MSTRLIRLADGTLVEAEVLPNEAQPINAGAAKQVEKSIDRIGPILVNVCKPISAAWQQISQDMDVEHAEVELGLSFEGEGNLYVTKATAGANLVVKLTLKPRASYKD